MPVPVPVPVPGPLAVPVPVPSPVPVPVPGSGFGLGSGFGSGSGFGLGSGFEETGGVSELMTGGGLEGGVPELTGTGGVTTDTGALDVVTTGGSVTERRSWVTSAVGAVCCSVSGTTSCCCGVTVLVVVDVDDFVAERLCEVDGRVSGGADASLSCSAAAVPAMPSTATTAPAATITGHRRLRLSAAGPFAGSAKVSIGRGPAPGPPTAAIPVGTGG